MGKNSVNRPLETGVSRQDSLSVGENIYIPPDELEEADTKFIVDFIENFIIPKCERGDYS